VLDVDRGLNPEKTHRENHTGGGQGEEGEAAEDGGEVGIIAQIETREEDADGMAHVNSESSDACGHDDERGDLELPEGRAQSGVVDEAADGGDDAEGQQYGGRESVRPEPLPRLFGLAGETSRDSAS
jgi:hypothetical protein